MTSATPCMAAVAVITCMATAAMTTWRVAPATTSYLVVLATTPWRWAWMVVMPLEVQETTCTSMLPAMAPSM
ncbi:hypothetical protein D3C80_2149600 [compost metagenome]